MSFTYERPALVIDQQSALLSAARILGEEFAGVFGRATVGRFLYSSYDQFAEAATVQAFLPLLAERFARQRLRALAKVERSPADAEIRESA